MCPRSMKEPVSKSRQEERRGDLTETSSLRAVQGFLSTFPLTADKLGNHRDVPIRDHHDLPDFNRIIPGLVSGQTDCGESKGPWQSRKLQERGYSGPVAEVELVTSPQILNTSEDRAHGTANNEKVSDNSQVFRLNN